MLKTISVGYNQRVCCEAFRRGLGTRFAIITDADWRMKYHLGAYKGANGAGTYEMVDKLDHDGLFVVVYNRISRCPECGQRV